MDAVRLTNALKTKAGELGFALAGVCPAVEPPGVVRLDEWLANGYAGQMHYIAGRREAYGRPDLVLSGARSILLLAMNYQTGPRQPTTAGEGRVSRYAWGTADYHDVIHQRLARLVEFLSELAPNVSARGVVDSAPLMEREFAQLAGLGWVGKNTLLLHRDLGSWFFLAALLTDADLVVDAPHAVDHCGSCRACLDACPTDAFPQPYVLDATRCISYLTIELKESIPLTLRSGLEDWLFGCDVCQDVCPWNRSTPPSAELTYQPRDGSNPIDLVGLFFLSDDAFRARFRHTPLWRPKRRGILRNAAIVLGNRTTPTAVPALAHGLDDSEPLVRASCAWALGNYTDTASRNLLAKRREIERDPLVRDELDQSWQKRQIEDPQ